MVSCDWFFSKIQQYSPSEAAKVYEKSTSRRTNTLFNPKGTLQKLKEGNPPEYLDEEGKRNLIRQYLDVSIFKYTLCVCKFLNETTGIFSIFWKKHTNCGCCITFFAVQAVDAEAGSR